MDYDKPKPIFKTAAARKDFVAAVSSDFEKAGSQSELLAIYAQHWAKIALMAASENEHDQLSAEILEARYKSNSERIHMSSGYMRKIIEEWEERQLAE